MSTRVSTTRHVSHAVMLNTVRERELSEKFGGDSILGCTVTTCESHQSFRPQRKEAQSLNKIGLWERLVCHKPESLTLPEARAIQSIRINRSTIQQARSFLLPYMPQEVEHEHSNLARVQTENPTESSSTITQTNAMDVDQTTQDATQVSSAIGYYPSAPPFVRSPNDWLSESVIASTRTCETCMEDLPSSKFPNMTQTSSCNHTEATVCIDCFTQYIEAQAISATLTEIKCPERNCNNILDYNLMKQCASTTIFDRYDSYVNSKALENAENFVHCANKACDVGGIVDILTTTYITCPQCEIKTCVTCKTVWHANLSHEENEHAVQRAQEEEEQRARDEIRKNMEDLKSQKTVEANTKACPAISCGVRIQKNGGCDHMMCYICKHEFCWLCSADYDPIRRQDNHHHKKGCAHYA